MAMHRKPVISPRKLPQQGRSSDLVTAILKAAIQVLEKEGANRFTTARVAERAGVSVGSLYQYFPNKAAILFRLQRDEWHQTAELLSGILADKQRPPLERLRALVQTFVRSECDEAAIRVALNDAAPLYRHAAETNEARTTGRQAVEDFMVEALPRVTKATRLLASDLLMMTLTSVGKQFSGRARTHAEIKAFADAMADMFCAYLKSVAA